MCFPSDCKRVDSRRFINPILLVVLLTTVPTLLSAADANSRATFLQRYCLDCHTGPDAENGFDIVGLGNDLQRPEVMAKWVRLFDRVERNEMPPKDSDQSSDANRAAYLAALGKSLTAASAAQASTVLRRLNRVEYENTLNDMLGVRESLVDLLPEDGKPHGFDNVGEALDLSSVHLERYMAAAGKVIDAAIRKSPQPDSKRSKHSLADGKRNPGRIGLLWHQTKEGAVVLFNNGKAPRPELEGFRAPMEGTYHVRISGNAHQSTDPVAFDLWQGSFGVGGNGAKVATLEFAPGESQTHELKVWLKRNARFVVLPHLNGSHAEIRKLGPTAYEGRGLAIAGFEIEGPIYEQWPGRGHELMFGGIEAREIEPPRPQIKKQKWYRPQFELISENPGADAERLLRGFLPVAFRRPVNDADLAPLLALVTRELEKGADFEAAMKSGYIAALCSPDFLYLREREDNLDDFALAARLSYAFWNSLPDGELRRLAAEARLSQPDVLRAQTERLLSDPRSSRAADSSMANTSSPAAMDLRTAGSATCSSRSRGRWVWISNSLAVAMPAA